MSENFDAQLRPRVVLTALGMVPSTGGSANTVSNFQRALGARVVSFTPARALAAEGTAIPGALHVPVGASLAGRLFLWAGAAARREADQLAATADLLSCHILYRYHAHWVRHWARRRKIPYWVVPHGCLDPYVFTYRKGMKQAWMAAYGRRFLAGARHVIFSTEKERRKAAAQYEGPNSRVVHWPVAPIDLAGAEETRAQARARLGLREEDRLLLYLGRLHEMKRPLETVAAVAAAQRDFVHLAIAGPDEMVTAEAVRAAGERLGARLRTPGAIYGEAKREWLLASDGFISLSHRENFGHSAAEALAAGKPVILSPGVDLGEELAPHECGWFLENDAPETAAAAIRAWADAPMEDLRARGERGRELMRREFTFEKFAEKLRALAAEAVAPA